MSPFRGEVVATTMVLTDEQRQYRWEIDGAVTEMQFPIEPAATD